MSFTFINKQARGGARAPKGSMVRVTKTKDRINFTLYKDFAEIFSLTNKDYLLVGIDGMRLAFVKVDDNSGYKLSHNASNDNVTLRFSMPLKAIDFISNMTVYIKEKHIDINDNMIIVDYGGALFETRNLRDI